MSVSNVLRRIVLINTVILCLILSTSTAYSFHDSKSRMRRCSLTVDNTKVAGTANISNYLLRLYRTNLPNEICSPTDNNNAQADAGDIVFSSDSAGATEIASYVYRWEYDSSDGAADAEILIFVEIPTLDYDDNTVIYMWWKAPTETMSPRFDQTYGAQDCFSTYTAFWPMVNQDGGYEEYIGLDATFDGNSSKDAADFHILVSDQNSASGEYAAWPSATLLSDGTILCGYREDGIHNFSADGGIIIRQSTDNGATWSAHSTFDTADVDDRDCGIVELDNGQLMMAVKRVDVDANNEVGVTFYDAGWGAIDLISECELDATRGKPLYMSNGDVLVPLYGYYDADNTTFEAWACVYDLSTSSYTNYLVYAEDTALTEWSVVEDPQTPGTLYGFFRSAIGTHDIYKSTSTNYGATWSNPAVNIVRDDLNDAPPEVQYNPYGDLLLAYSLDREDYDSRLKRSVDDGANYATDYAILVGDANIGPAGTGYYESFAQINRHEILTVMYEDSDATGYANIYCTVSNIIAGQLTNYRLKQPDWFATAATFANGCHWNGSSEYWTAGAASVYNFFHTTGIFTISLWLKLDDNTAAAIQTIFDSVGLTNANKGITIFYDNRNLGDTTNNALRCFIADAAPPVIIDSASEKDVITDNNWHYITVKGDATNVFFYIDGTADTGTNSMTAKTTGDSTYAPQIGRYGAGSGYLDGCMKMYSIRADCITEGHAQTEEENESAPATFVTEGSPSSGGFVPKVISY